MPQTITKGYKALLEEANNEVKTLTIEEAKALHGNADVVFVDLRDPRELEREGKVPGAFHCPRGMLEFWIDPESPYAKPIFQEDKQFVFFCAGGLALGALGPDRPAHGPEAGRPCRRRLWRLEEDRRPDGRMGGQAQGVSVHHACE